MTTLLETAIARASGPLGGVLRVPGDKSISHRAVILSSLALGTGTIHGLLESDDVLATVAAMRALGADIGRTAEAWRVRGVGVGGLATPDRALDFGNSGTGARLLMGAMATHPLSAELTGDASLCSRPMGRVIAPLEQMGARIAAAPGGRLPAKLTGARQPVPITYEVPVASAQVKSAILLAGLNTPGRTCVIEPVATRDHTERLLADFGAAIRAEQRGDGAVHIALQGYAELSARDITVPADPSSAAFPLVGALIVPGSDITLKGVLINAGRNGLLTTLREMGGDISVTNERMAGGETVGDIQVRSSRLRAVRVPADRAPSMIDEYPVLAVAAAFGEGESVMAGLGELRVKESNRLAAIARGLAACGVGVRVSGDDLRVSGGAPVRGGARIAAGMDHRIAMAFLVLGLAAESPVRTDSANMIATSFPGFFEAMRSLGADIAGEAGAP